MPGTAVFYGTTTVAASPTDDTETTVGQLNSVAVDANHNRVNLALDVIVTPDAATTEVVTVIYRGPASDLLDVESVSVANLGGTAPIPIPLAGIDYPPAGVWSYTVTVRCSNAAGPSTVDTFVLTAFVGA